jgi:CRISPR-associated endonuclease Cas1
VGRHTLHTSAISNLVKAGCRITFFEVDGEPVASISAYGKTRDSTIRDLQKSASPHRYAVEIAKGSIRSKIRAIQEMNEVYGINLFFEGELDVLHTSLNELEYLIKLSEIRRIHRFCSDMYYEIMARTVSRALGFKRRTERPHQDPINAILSYGYAMLFGNCWVSVIGANLDPDLGMLYDGPAGLVYDLIEPLKATMIDTQIFRTIGKTLEEHDFEYSRSRCILSDDLMKKLTDLFRTSIDQKKVDEQVFLMVGSLRDGNKIQILS